MTTPLVSVCIPVYNGERFIEATLRSVLSQSLQDFEIVVVDNASTDATLEVLGRFTDPRIQVFRNDRNLGPVANFNRSLCLARGKFLKLLCADDLIYPTCLERQVAVLEADSDGGLVMVSCARDIIDEQGDRWLGRKFPGRGGRKVGEQAVLEILRAGSNILGEPAAVLIRAEAVRATGGFDPDYRFCVDLEFLCRVLLLGDLHVLDATLSAFRVRRQSWSMELAHLQSEEFSAFIETMRPRLTLPLPRHQLLVGRFRANLNSILRRLIYRAINLKLSWREMRSSPSK